MMEATQSSLTDNAVDNKRASSQERIIPIRILSSRHHDQNDNLANKMNNNEASNLNMLVTLDDGTVTQTQGSVHNLNSSSGGSSQQELSIQEIGQETLTRELSKEKKVRIVPIKLTDGKVTIRDPDESVQVRTEFTNYVHQEFPNEDHKEIPRMDAPSQEKKAQAVRERIVPITLDETGETIMPSFSQLEDPQPPEWSAFSKSNKNNKDQREVPLKVITASEEDETDLRGRERTKSSPRSASKKNSVRFDLNNEDAIGKKIISEKRSSSVETYSRKTTTTTTTSKPPKTPTSTRYGRTASMERPASATPTTSPSTEKTLQEIDRDITKIWKELQELEKLPNGSYHKGAASRPASSPNNATSQVPVTPVRIRATYTPTPMSASPKYSRESPRVTFATPSTTPSSGRRTIWDTDPDANCLRPSPPKDLGKFHVTVPQIRPPPPPLPPHLRPQVIKMAPIARDESFYDLGSKSPSTASCYDNTEYSPNSGKFKGFPYIDGAPRKRSQSPNGNKAEALMSANNFSVLVDKSTQTPEEKARSKDACVIL